MATIEWFRLWHDMPNDPKWRTIARVSGQSISVVQAVWLQLLVSASQAEERGTYTISEEDIASALNESDEAVSAIINAMQGRVLDGKHLTAWARRQPSREDGVEGRGKASGSNYVYYVVDTERDVVKIGISRNPWARIKDLQVGSASKFKLLATLKTDERSEKAIHKFFQATRLEGEWFRRCNALNSLIQKTISNEISSFECSVEYLSSLPVDDYVATVDTVATTKDTDTDTEKSKEEPPIPPNGGHGPEETGAGKPARRAAIALKTFLANCREAGEKPISEDDPVFDYAEKTGIPIDVLRLHWLEFKARYSIPDAKRYKDWRTVYRKSVRGNWFRLWFLRADGSCGLTTQGEQARREHQQEAA
ncbi:GIY-YIG nuclease family protein [Burkholderia vietnamiensis]|uniref:GIY-YIG nuclease family protein n=1 Tax=Burkholderia vietnamiensis TaxID=60552 RepID=UPI00158881F4|nr:GIY-YIG nuclease family protein [Burkholderia vietnamiensis]